MSCGTSSARPPLKNTPDGNARGRDLGLPSFEVSDWLKQTGDFPLGYEAPHAAACLHYALRLLRDTHPQRGPRFANAPCFETGIFAHIPKTAGTAAVEALRPRQRSRKTANLSMGPARGRQQSITGEAAATDVATSRLGILEADAAGSPFIPTRYVVIAYFLKTGLSTE